MMNHPLLLITMKKHSAESGAERPYPARIPSATVPTTSRETGASGLRSTGGAFRPITSNCPLA